MVRGEVGWATAPGGDRPVRRVVACSRTERGLSGELPLGPEEGMPAACVAAFDNPHPLRRGAFRRPGTRLSAAKMADDCRVLSRAPGRI